MPTPAGQLWPKSDASDSVQKWQPTTVYALGETAQAPDGSLVKAKAAHTSGASYTAANWTSTATYAGTQAASELSATYALKTVQSPSQLAAGLFWIFAGDSITNGSYAANFAYSYMPEALTFAGGMVARYDAIEAGTPGDTSAGLLARMDSLITTYSPQAFVIFIGANDANQGVTITDYAANMTAIIGKAKAAGCPVVLCTTPPRSSAATAAIQQAVVRQNVWIQTFGPSFGCHVADIYSALVDTTTGNLAAANDSGDGLHPTSLGHTLMAQVVAKAMIRARNLTAPYGLVRANAPVSIGNMISDPLALVGTTLPSGWFEQPGGSGTAPVYAPVGDTSGFLPAGRWTQMDFTATAGGTRRISTNAFGASYWVPGDRLLVTFHLQVEDVTGTWQADVVGATAGITAQVVNTSTGVALTGAGWVNRAVGIPQGGGVYNIGPMVVPFTVPAATPGMCFWVSVTLPTGKRVKVRVGNVGVLNVTQLGMAAAFNWGSIQVNI